MVRRFNVFAAAWRLSRMFFVCFFDLNFTHPYHRSFYLEPVYRLVPVFNPFLMASLLVRLYSSDALVCLLNLPQIFKIVAPFVILSAAFATLNARLDLPPFSLFLVALTLTDGIFL